MFCWYEIDRQIDISTLDLFTKSGDAEKLPTKLVSKKLPDSKLKFYFPNDDHQGRRKRETAPKLVLHRTIKEVLARHGAVAVMICGSNVRSTRRGTVIHF